MTDTANQIDKSGNVGATLSYATIGGAAAYILVWYIKQFRGITLDPDTAAQLQLAFTPILTAGCMAVVGICHALHNVINKKCFNGEDVI